MQDVLAVKQEFPPHNSKLPTDKEILEDIINSWNLDESLNLEEPSPEVRYDTYLWVIREKEKELNRYKAFAEESINRTTRWLESKDKSITSAIDFLSNQIKFYLKSSNLKSLSLPNGKIGFRKNPSTLEIIDEDIFFANALPEFIRHTPENFEPNIKAIKEHIKKTSELPQGVELKGSEPKFYYKLSQD